MSEKLTKMYSFKISEKMLSDMRSLSDRIDNWSAWIREQIEKKIQELKKESGEYRPRFCPNCGKMVEENDNFCGHCGHKLID
ncbi:MAG: zinc ribbon domain-containing protein [Candidatus Helarchaeota archaeon]